MKFKLENFLELDTTQLLAVNGGSGCGGSSGGGSYSGSSSSGGGSSGGGSSSSGSSSSSSGGGSGGGSCGGGTSSSVVSSNGGGSSSGGSGGGSCGGSTSAITTVVSSVKTGSSSGGGSCSRFDLSPYKQQNDMQKDESSWGGIEKGSANEKSKMQDHENFSEDAEMNGTSINKNGQEESNLFSKVGCKMEGAAKISTEILGTNVDIRDVNSKYDVNKDGLLTQSEIENGIKAGLGKDKTLSTNYYEKTLNKAQLDAISASKEGTTYMLGRAEGVGGGQHWIVLEGYSINDRGQVQFKFNGTSTRDAGRTYILGKPESGQTNTFTISKIETYTVK